MRGLYRIAPPRVDVAELANGVGLIGLEVQHFEVLAFCFVVLAEFGVAECSHEVHLEDFGVLVDHDFQVLQGLLVLVLLNQLFCVGQLLLGVLVHNNKILQRYARSHNKST